MASPTDRRYSDKHFWAKQEGNNATFGLTAFNIASFGQVSSVSGLVDIGKDVTTGNALGTINRASGGDNFVAPVGGHVIDREDHLFDIGDVNTTPYGDASWFVRVTGVKQQEYDALMSAQEYDEFTTK